jgi:predicted nucleic acid-binding protein
VAVHAEHEEVMHYIEEHSLMGKGLGYIDAHLLVSAVLTQAPLWTLDRKLKESSSRLGLSYG